MYMMTYRSPIFLLLFLLVITSLALFLPLSKIMSQKIIDVINEKYYDKYGFDRAANVYTASNGSVVMF